jgi:hypothetical protein
MIPSPTWMLYKHPGKNEIDGKLFDWMVVEEAGIEQAQADGWRLTTAEAVALYEENLPPTRSELETKATELGLTFDGRTSDAKLSKMISDAIAAANAQTDQPAIEQSAQPEVSQE